MLEKLQPILEQNIALMVQIAVKFTLFIVIILITVIANKLAKKALKKYFEAASKKIKIDQTQFNFFRHLISALIYIIGIGLAIFSIPQLRALSVSLFAGAGILAIIIGFASQEAFSNIVSGIMITIFKPFHVGDRVKVGAEIRGVVEDITLRHTIIKDFENKRVIIPNSVMGREVIENSTIEDAKIMKWVEMSISYDSDMDKAMRIMREEAEAHPEIIDNRTDKMKEEGKPIVNTRVVGFADSAVLLRAYAWTKDPIAAWNLGCDVNYSIKKRFDDEGIEIPFPYRTVVYKKDLPKNTVEAKKYLAQKKKSSVKKAVASKKTSKNTTPSQKTSKIRSLIKKTTQNSLNKLKKNFSKKKKK